MAWLIITDDCQIRLVDGKPRFYSRDRLSLREVFDRVQAWTRSHEDCRVDAWIEAAEEELDLDARIERILEVDSLLGFNTTREAARVRAVRARQFEKGERALEQGDYSGALGSFSDLAESGHPNAQFELGLMSAQGLGSPKDYLRAYMWFGAAAQRGHKRAEDAKTLPVSRLTNDELAEVERRIAELRVKDESSIEASRLPAAPFDAATRLTDMPDTLLRGSNCRLFSYLFPDPDRRTSEVRQALHEGYPRSSAGKRHWLNRSL